jgi:hypothetical protein
LVLADAEKIPDLTQRPSGLVAPGRTVAELALVALLAVAALVTTAKTPEGLGRRGLSFVAGHKPDKQADESPVLSGLAP